MNFYDFTLKDWQGNDVPLKNYAGKVVMVVNTATRCGFTPQYKELEELYERYHDAGLEILDIPCNQFGKIVFLALFFNSLCRLLRIFPYLFVQLLPVTPALYRVHHNIFRRHKGYFLHKLAVYHLRIYNESIRHILIKTQNRVNS